LLITLKNAKSISNNRGPARKVYPTRPSNHEFLTGH